MGVQHILIDPDGDNDWVMELDGALAASRNARGRGTFYKTASAEGRDGTSLLPPEKGCFASLVERLMLN